MIPVLISARSNSRRLPHKHFLPMASASSVISFLVLRCVHFGFEPYICCPKGDYQLFTRAHPQTPVYTQDADSAEECVIGCANSLDLKIFHHLDGDDPWFDEYAVIDSYNAVASGRVGRVNPSYHSQSGSGRVGTSYNLLTKGVRNLLDKDGLPWPQRLTIDYMEDHHLISAVDRMVGGYMAPRAAVDKLFIDNPQLHLVNWWRNQEWKERQNYERSSSAIRAQVRETDRE